MPQEGIQSSSSLRTFRVPNEAMGCVKPGTLGQVAHFYPSAISESQDATFRGRGPGLQSLAFKMKMGLSRSKLLTGEGLAVGGVRGVGRYLF